MKISVKDGKSCEKIIKIELGEEEISREFNTFYSEVAPKAKIPGFRPGKAPRHILELHYKGDARDAVLKNLINDAYRQALTDHKIDPLGYPVVDDVEFDDKKLAFKAQVEVRPKIKLSRVKGLSAKREKPVVKPEEIETQLTQMRETQAQYKAVEDRAAVMGNFVIADYTCLVDGKEVEKREGDWFELREEEYLKGFSKQLEGVKPGEDREVKVTFPEKMGRPEMAGKEAVFQVKVKEIKEKVLPELDDELAKTLGDHQTLKDLRKKIEGDLLAQKQKVKESEYERALLDELLKHNKLDLPPKLLEKRIEQLYEDARSRFQAQGGPEGEFEKQKESMRPDIEKEARRQLHTAFLLDEIAETEKISVGEEDVHGKIRTIAERIRQPLEEVEKYYMNNEGALQALADQVRNEKTLEFIKANTKQ